MTKKHFDLIAKNINYQKQRAEQYDAESREAQILRLELLADDLAEDFKLLNPHFDRDKFLTACGF